MSASTKRGRNGSEDSEDGASGDASENEDLDAGAPEEDAEGRAAAAKQRRMAINRRTAHSSRIRKKQVREDGGEEEERRGRRSRLCYPVRVRNVVQLYCVWCVTCMRIARCANAFPLPTPHTVTTLFLPPSSSQLVESLQQTATEVTKQNEELRRINHTLQTMLCVQVRC